MKVKKLVWGERETAPLQFLHQVHIFLIFMHKLKIDAQGLLVAVHRLDRSSGRTLCRELLNSGAIEASSLTAIAHAAATFKDGTVVEAASLRALSEPARFLTTKSASELIDALAVTGRTSRALQLFSAAAATGCSPSPVSLAALLPSTLKHQDK